MIEPFVFRKYLDFTNIEEIRTMKEQIDISLKRKKGDVVDVKLGRGGIREIEFFVQANQLIHGGKNKNLRTKKTLDTLKMLFLNKLITEEEANTLTSCYIYLRNLEHRIQIVQGRQSQSIPTNKTELLRLAAMTGIRKDGDEGLDCRFWEEYKSYSDKVHQIYNTLFYSSENEMENALDEIYLPFIDKEICDDELLEILNNQNVISAQEALNSIILIRDGSKGSRLSVKAKTQREKLLPHIIKKSIDTGLPMKALKHLEMFFAATGSRINLYSMIRENTELLNILIKIFAESTYLANVLIRHPENLDTLLSSEKGKATKSIEELKNDFSVMIKTCQHDDYEEKLQTVRNFKNEEFFRIGLNDLSLANDFNKTSIEISNVADVILDGAIEIAKDELRSKFGVLVNDSENNYFILGLGKYGSKELTYGSDLDILFVYESPDNAVTDGVKKVSAMEYYTALSRKIINLLSTNTKEGIAFKLDAELRPSGSAGPLVTSVNSLMDYQKNKAQFWEHQALIRQRPVAGNLSFGELVSEKLYDIIFNKKISDDDIKEVVRLRQRMEKEIANEKEGVYDLKTGYGGMVDIEFIIQVMQLKFGYEIADLRTPYTIDGLNKLVQHDIISKIDGEILKNAFDYYKKLQSRLRIEFDKPEGKINTLTDELKGTIYKDNNEKAELIKKLTDTKQSVRNLFTKIIK